MWESIGEMSRRVLEIVVSGGVLGLLAAVVTARWQARREDASERRRARVSARILRGDYRMWQNAIVTALRSREWWPDAEVAAAIRTDGDVRAVAEWREGFAEWQVVGHVDRRLRRHEHERRSTIRPNPQELARTFLDLEKARRELAKLDDGTFNEHPKSAEVRVVRDGPAGTWLE